MQMNLDSASVVRQTIALPTPGRLPAVRRTRVPTRRSSTDLERSRQEVLDGFLAERIVWLILWLSTLGVLALSLFI